MWTQYLTPLCNERLLPDPPNLPIGVGAPAVWKQTSVSRLAALCGFTQARDNHPAAWESQNERVRPDTER